MGNHHFQWVNPLFLWPCSIAMLVYQRVGHAMSPPWFFQKTCFSTDPDRWNPGCVINSPCWGPSMNCWNCWWIPMVGNKKPMISLFWVVYIIIIRDIVGKTLLSLLLLISLYLISRSIPFISPLSWFFLAIFPWIVIKVGYRENIGYIYPPKNTEQSLITSSVYVYQLLPL